MQAVERWTEPQYHRYSNLLSIWDTNKIYRSFRGINKLRRLNKFKVEVRFLTVFIDILGQVPLERANIQPCIEWSFMDKKLLAKSYIVSV